MNGHKKERLIVILGPTAVGKTALAVALARRLRSRIISGDSMLVYKGFDIGTAKPDMTERQGVQHELIDILEPADSFNVTDFVMMAQEKIHEANCAGEIPILAGGTGLYVKSLLEGYEFNITEGDPEYRRHLEQLAEERGREYVHSLLAAVDKEAAARIHANNFRRVVRALEVHQLGGETISTDKRLAEDGLSYDALVIGLRRERSALYERINRRVDVMMAAGLVAEVKNLLAAGVRPDAQAMKGIGYKEIIAYLDGECSLEEAVSEIKKGTRHFAKRQFTWYRKMPYIQWFDIDNMGTGELMAKAYESAAEFFDLN